MLLNDIIEEVGMTKRAVKYYEEKGLLSVDKDSNGYRNYTQQDVETLKKISVYRKLGISIKDIQKLLESDDKTFFFVFIRKNCKKNYCRSQSLRRLGNSLMMEMLIKQMSYLTIKQWKMRLSHYFRVKNGAII